MQTAWFVRAAAVGLALLAQPAQSQQLAPEAQVAASAAALRQQYTESFAGLPQLLSGPEYVDYTKWYASHDGHQFFRSAEKLPGSVHYNGAYYPNLTLRYDVVRDQLVLPQLSSPLTLALSSERVREFLLDGHRFVRLPTDSAARLSPGFYEVLLEGTAQVLAKRVKLMQQQTVNRQLTVQFYSRDKLFVQKAGAYYPVTGKGALLRVFAERGKELRSYAQAQRLSFKKESVEASMVAVVRYYNSLAPR